MPEMSYEKMHEDFIAKYYNEVVPKLESYEGERKKSFAIALACSVPIVLLGIAILIIFIALDISGHGKDIDADCYRLPIFIFIGGIAIYHFYKKKFENKIKEKVMPTVCSCFENIVWINTRLKKGNNKYNKYNREYDELYKKLNLMPNYDTVKYDDCFKGSYNDTSYDIEEFQAIRGSGKNRVLIFKGAVVSIEMHKHFEGRTVITSNSLFHHSPSKELHHTELEDIEFEKKFDVYTDNDVEARYLITPSLMERLNSMKLAFKAYKISVAFNDEKIYIALYTGKDLFSIASLKKNVCDYEQFNMMFEEIYSIVNLINYFKLDQKIGL